MAFGYIGMTLIVIVINITEIPSVLHTIVRNAFGWQEAVGGGMVAAIIQACAGASFSNEAGPRFGAEHGCSRRCAPSDQPGHHPVLFVFIDTIIICTCTAVIILMWEMFLFGAEGVDGIVLAQQSLASHMGGWTSYFLTGAILLFAFTDHL